ncbi:MAG: hypothetical protein ABFS24_16170 [Pseudomonadota bacterium]
MPKCHWLLFCVWCIYGSHALFLVVIVNIDNSGVHNSASGDAQALCLQYSPTT